MSIIKFEYGTAFLSNFFSSEVKYEGIMFPTVEHAFQAAKTFDVDSRVEISKLDSPGKAKKAGKRVKLRNDWEKVKFSIMEELVKSKFEDKDLMDRLIATGDHYLVEGTWWHDNIWGVCYCKDCSGTGSNYLGKTLMKVREELSRNRAMATLKESIAPLQKTIRIIEK